MKINNDDNDNIHPNTIHFPSAISNTTCNVVE